MSLITIKETSQILNRPRRTIVDWIGAGVLRVHKVKSMTYIDSDTVYALKDTEADIDHALSERKAILNEINSELKELRKATNLNHATVRFAITELVKALHLESLKAREWSVFELVMEGNSLHAVGEQYGITLERARQLFNRVVWKIQYSAKSYGQMLNENISMKEELEILKTAIAKKDRLLNEYRKLPKAQLSEDTEDSEEELKLLSKRIEDCELPIRAVNVLRYYDIHTVGDLIQLSKSEVYGLHNLGHRTFMALEEFMDSIGKKWGNKHLYPIYGEPNRYGFRPIIRHEIR